MTRPIRAWRKRKGLKLRELAAQAHVDIGHLSRVETGQREPSAELLGRIAHALSVEPPHLLLMEPPP